MPRGRYELRAAPDLASGKWMMMIFRNGYVCGHAWLSPFIGQIDAPDRLIPAFGTEKQALVAYKRARLLTPEDMKVNQILAKVPWLAYMRRIPSLKYSYTKQLAKKRMSLL